MNKEEHIKYWTSSSKIDNEIVEKLFLSKDYVYSLYLAHLSLEKLIKAVWIRTNKENFPPKSHNLLYLLEQCHIEIDLETRDFLISFNDFQIEGRYPDYQFKIYQKMNENNTSEILEKVKEIKKWIQGMI